MVFTFFRKHEQGEILMIKKSKEDHPKIKTRYFTLENIKKRGNITHQIHFQWLSKHAAGVRRGRGRIVKSDFSPLCVSCIMYQRPGCKVWLELKTNRPTIQQNNQVYVYSSPSVHILCVIKPIRPHTTGSKMMSWYESTKHTFLKVVKWC